MSGAGEACDVVVVGGGSAGVAAAVAAAEEGARTVLLEASGAVGGTLAWQLLEHSAGFHDIGGRQVTAGVGERIIQRMRMAGSSPGHVRDDVGYTATRTPVNHVELALTEAVMLGEAGVELWLHAPVVQTRQEAGRIVAVETETPGGRRVLRPAMVVDTSGDAVAARLAGARMHGDAAAVRQPASLTFKLGGVDFAALLAYARAERDDFRPDSLVGDDDAPDVNLWGFGRLLARGQQTGLLSLTRTELHLAGWPLRGEAVVNASRVASGCPGGNWTGAATVALSRQVLEFARWFREMVPGCAQTYVAAVADRVGVRESARVVGRHTLTEAEVLGSVVPADTVALAAFPIDIHETGRPSMAHTAQLRDPFGIAYGCLVAEGLDNLLMAGRCLSSTHEANGSARITATCFATGEAAGVAAAMAARTGHAAVALPVGSLQTRLRERGAVLDVASAVGNATAPIGRVVQGP